MTLYALALGSNVDRDYWLETAAHHLKQWGTCQFSSVYEIACRDGLGQDYYNVAVLLYSDASLSDVLQRAKQLEQLAGRVRPSHQITLDIDLIAMGCDVQHLVLTTTKLPLAFDVCLPLAELWSDCPHCTQKMCYKLVNKTLK